MTDEDKFMLVVELDKLNNQIDEAIDAAQAHGMIASKAPVEEASKFYNKAQLKINIYKETIGSIQRKLLA